MRNFFGKVSSSSDEDYKKQEKTMNRAKRKKMSFNMSANVLIHGKTITFVACSLISALINLIFISNLTKSPYNIGGLISIPAAVFLGGLSIALDFSKVLHVVQVTTLKELYRKISDEPWSNKIKKVVNKWTGVYLMYVALSVITSISLSTISIGEGITRNANTLKTIDKLMAEGDKYANIDSTTKDIKLNNIVDKATDTSESDANKIAKQKANEVWPFVEEWQNEYQDFKSEFGEEAVDDKTELEEPYKGSKSYFDYWLKRDREVNNKLSSSGYSYSKLKESQINALTYQRLVSTIRANYLENNKTSQNDNALSSLQEINDSTMAEALGWIETLNATQLVNPESHEVIIFDTDPNKSPKVLINSAMGRLSALRTKVENDSGDIGPSSKIFMQLGSFIDGLFHKDTSDLKEVVNAKATRTSFGTTEILMMLMLLFLSLLCELAINQFSPKVRISRKLLYQFSEYLPKKFNIDKFMKEVDEELIKFDILDVSRDTELKVIEKNLGEDTIKVTRKTNKRKPKQEVIEVSIPEVKQEKEEIKEEEPKIESKPEKVVAPVENIKEEDSGFSSDVDDMVNEIEELLK